MIRALDKVCEYYRRTEPSSPVPFLLERAKRMAAMDFVELMRELAPDGLKQATNVMGVSPDAKG